jgi:tetratricopeptide (TPR) repeat protein
MKKIIFYFLLITSGFFAKAQQQPCSTIVLPQLSDETRKQYEQKVQEAKSKLVKDSANAEHLIWYGRRTAYTGRYMEAIEIYSQGISFHPNNSKFYRHRGHRYITVRCFDLAIADLTKATILFKDQVDEVEEDGLPNAQNIPTGTLQSNTWYHLGLVHFLKGDYKNALVAFNECLEITDNDDMYVATANWLFITMKRLGKNKEADELLKSIKAEMDIIENKDYHEILLMYKNNDDKKLIVRMDSFGEKTLTQDNISNATLGFGLANYYLEKGQKKKAKELLEKIVAGNQWASFGFIAAEADLKRIR